jgi:hypothetical protein
MVKNIIYILAGERKRIKVFTWNDKYKKPLLDYAIKE